MRLDEKYSNMDDVSKNNLTGTLLEEAEQY